jgi:hypothetical protein
MRRPGGLVPRATQTVARAVPPLRKAFEMVTQAVDRRIGWDRLPKLPGLVVLVGLRNVLRRENLYDTGGAPARDAPSVAPFEERFRTERTADGSHNDLAGPAMGMAGARFGRNVPLDRTYTAAQESALLSPSPRTVSRRLLTRREFVPATTVNNLAAAWLQFMIRDWFSHGANETENPWSIELDPDDIFPGGGPMKILRTRRDPTRPPDEDPATAPAPTYVNTSTHWWDGSSIYGRSRAEQKQARSGVDGKLLVGLEGRLPAGDPEHDPTREPGFWTGLLMMQLLFAREHNAICEHLKASYPQLDDEQLFQRARLVNAALLAKIHTAEWTPAVISHPTTVTALRANWFGLAGEQVRRRFGRISASEAISGIPGSKTDHFGVPFSLTEEFVAVYRMHPLIADEWSLREARDDSPIAELSFRDLAGPVAVDWVQKLGLVDLFYSFGTEHPGLVTLHNFPRFLQEFERADGTIMDLASVDVLRTRELGVPRYCELRRLLRLKAPRTFEELTDNPTWAQELREVYGDVEQVDLMVGMYAEKLPKGFAFSDTAFRIFILMASRRLNSDRFFTTDYGPHAYTQAGLDWIADNGMSDVLLRHMPQLGPALEGLDNAFKPFNRAGATA